MGKKEIKPRIVKGRVILKLKEAPSRAVTTSVPTGRRSSTTSLGIDSLDNILENYGTKGITKLRRLSVESLLGVEETSRAAQPRTAHEEFGFTRTYIVTVPPETDLKSMIKDLKEDPNVEDAEVDYFATISAVPNDQYYNAQWGLQKIECRDGWDIEKGDPDVIIAIIDTGVDQSHPDLMDKLIAGYDMVDLTGVDELEEGCTWDDEIYIRDNNPEDRDGHGTHCAGIAAASTNNNVGVAGVAWNCKIMPVKALARVICPDGETATGSFTDIADCIIWAADNGADVISMSLSGFVPKGEPPSELVNAINYVFTKGCVIVAAMGNESVNIDEYDVDVYPAAHSNVLAVGAIDRNGRRATFSNYGDYKHVMAPGVGILSTYLRSESAYAELDGTSMATPFVAGLAALVKSANPHLTPSEIVGMIRETADSQGGYNTEYGYGIVSVHSALERTTPPDMTETIQPCEAMIEGHLSGNGDEKYYKIPVASTLNINLDGPDGADFDLYLKKGAPPTITDYDKRAYTVKSDETITFPIEGSGDYHVMVKSYRGSGDFKLVVKRE